MLKRKLHCVFTGEDYVMVADTRKNMKVMLYMLNTKANCSIVVVHCGVSVLITII